jgi:Protein of unknown function (DUF3592)
VPARILNCLFFGTLFLGIGCAGLGLQIREALELRRSRLEWRSTPGVMEQVPFKRIRNNSYSSKVSYAFEVQGRIHRGDRLAFGISAPDFIRASVNRYFKGDAVLVWYDPADPSRNVLERRMSGTPLAMLFLFLVLTLLGLMSAVSMIFHTRDILRRLRGPPPL